jgi:predicted regulator of Ras-like GTPase activity (Roadblock/LC7/MglB family)
MKAILEELNRTLAARGALVVAKDGMLVASDVREGVDVERLAALGASLVGDVGASMVDSGFSAFSHIELAAEDGKVVVAEAGSLYLLVLVGARLEIGPGSIEIQSAARKLVQASDLAFNQ